MLPEVRKASNTKGVTKGYNKVYFGSEAFKLAYKQVITHVQKLGFTLDELSKSHDFIINKSEYQQIGSDRIIHVKPVSHKSTEMDKYSF